MSCELLQKLVDQGTTALAEAQAAPDKSEAKTRGASAVNTLTVAAQAALKDAQAAPDGAMAAVSSANLEALAQAAAKLQEMALIETYAVIQGRQAAFGDGTLLRILLEYLPMLLELFKTFFGAQPEGTQPA